MKDVPQEDAASGRSLLALAPDSKVHRQCAQHQSADFSFEHWDTPPSGPPANPFGISTTNAVQGQAHVLGVSRLSRSNRRLLLKPYYIRLASPYLHTSEKFETVHSMETKAIAFLRGILHDDISMYQNIAEIQALLYSIP